MNPSQANFIFERFIPQIGVAPLPELLTGLFREVARLMNVERVGYFRFVDDHTVIQQEVQFYLSTNSCDTAGLARLKASDYPGYFEVIMTPPGVLVSDEVMGDVRLKEFWKDYFLPLNISSMLDVPVHRAGQLYGVICHEHIGPSRTWANADVETARMLANIVALAIETDQRQNIEAALRDSETRFRTLIEHTPAAVVVFDADVGKFVEVNENAMRLFGMNREDLLKVGPAELSPAFQPDGRLSSKAARENILLALSGKSPVFEWTHRTRRGKTIPCEIRVARMPAEQQNLVVGAITDVTDRKRAEAEFEKALQQEKELGELKTNFVNLVSHEFRTPLGVILSAADILENYFDRLKPEQRQGHLKDIQHATRQMSSLMEEVLLLGRVEAGRMECKPAQLDLAEFCGRLVDEQHSATHRKCPIELVVDGVGDLAEADEALLRHMLNNLLSNAVKYSNPGSPVQFNVRRDGRECVFEIRDHGIGIPVADQPGLFEAFHRGSNVANIPGTGLGLVIVKRCADLHGARIDVSSMPGRGTTFQIRMQMFADEASGSRPAKRVKAKTAKSRHAKNPRH